ncbi:MAG TPA: hypothetical protein VJ891_07940 [Casimicrobiaceae bacterium]|nr:hypothetical protein [Casimicrobiaceae bacterium]
MTILFLDVVGSTALARKLDPEDTQAIMDGALGRFTEVVRDAKPAIAEQKLAREPGARVVRAGRFSGGAGVGKTGDS